MSTFATVDTLNLVLQVHYRSLPMYLAEAEPWRRHGSTERVAVVQDLINDDVRFSKIAADWIQRRGGVIDLGEFPIGFTDTNDLALDFLIEEIVNDQQGKIADLEDCLKVADVDPGVRSLAQEALGAARGHLQSLQEIRPAGVTS